MVPWSFFTICYCKNCFAHLPDDYWWSRVDITEFVLLEEAILINNNITKCCSYSCILSRALRSYTDELIRKICWAFKDYSFTYSYGQMKVTFKKVNAKLRNSLTIKVFWRILNLLVLTSRTILRLIKLLRFNLYTHSFIFITTHKNTN